MKKVQELVKQAKSQVLQKRPQNLPVEKTSSISKDHSAAMWEGLGKVFGKVAMAAHAGNLQFWHDQLCLKGINPEELEKGCQGVIDLGHQFPPSVGEFINLCRPPPPPGPVNRTTYVEDTSEEKEKLAAEKTKYRESGEETPLKKLANKIRSKTEKEEEIRREKIVLKPLNEEEHNRLMADESMEGRIYRARLAGIKLGDNEDET